MSSLLKKSEGIELTNRRYVNDATQTSYDISTSSKPIRINVQGGDEHIDWENTYLAGDLTVNWVTGTAALPRYAASGYMRELRFKDRAGNQIGENVQKYAELVRTTYELQATTDQESSFLDATELALGVADTGASFTVQFSHRIITHIPAMKNYFPIKYFGGLQIIIDTKPAADFLMSSSTSNTYTLSNVRLVTRYVQLKPEVENVIFQAVQEGLKIDYVSTHCIAQNVVATTATQRFDLGSINGRVKNIQTVQFTSKTAGATDHLATMDRNDLESYRYKLGNRNLSESPVQMSATTQAEYLMEYLISQKLTSEPLGLYGKTALTKSALLASKFVIGQSVDRSKSDSVLSSLKDKDNNNLSMVLTFGTSAARELLTFISIDKRLIVMPGKQFADDDFTGQGTTMAV